MKLNRNYVTPFIFLVFLVVAITGVLMLFHLFDGYTEVAHEILGAFFILCSIAHAVLNWKALKIHFKRGVFLPALAGIFFLSAILVVSEIMYPPVDLTIMRKLTKAPIHDAFSALGVNYEIASESLKEMDILIDEARTMEDLWIQNDADPEKIIDLLLNE